MIPLPAPGLDSGMPLEEALTLRRSVRDFTADSLTIEELAQLLWSCQGITSSQGFRTAPSAGALYPLEVFVIVDRVSGLSQGVYHYRPGPGKEKHSLELLQPGVNSRDMARAALDQNCIRNSAISIVIATVVSRTSSKYGDRAERYVMIEVGHAAQNICLQAQTLNLGAITVGAFKDNQVRKLIAGKAEPAYIISVGKKGR